MVLILSKIQSIRKYVGLRATCYLITRGQIASFFSSHFAFMSDRGRLAVLSLYRCGVTLVVIINQAENRGR